MNENHGLTRENLLRSLPVSVSGDSKMLALAGVIAGALERRREELERIAIYPHIDRLDEGLLDILARDFKVDWWDGDYTPDEKRRTLAASWQVHKALGTKGAVVKAITSIYREALVEEWFEYGGEPYHFRLTVRLSENGWDYGKHLQLLEKLQYYKNLRSHRDAIKYYLPLVTVTNSERILLESLLIRGRFAFNEQQLSRTRLFLKWAAARTITGSAGFITRLRMENSDRLWLNSVLIRSRLSLSRERLGRTWLHFAMSAAQDITVGAGIILRSVTENQEKVSLPRLLIGPYSIDVLGLEAARFDGTYSFDGSCYFWYTFKRRPAFYSMNLLSGAENRERISGGVQQRLKGSAQNGISLAAGGMYRARDSTSSTPRHTGTAMHIRAKNRNTVTAYLTEDSMWHFDGACTFGGERRFNAKTERSEL